MAQMVKSLPAMQETHVCSLGWEDPLEKGIATHSSIFAWRIPWTEEPGRLQSMASQRIRDILATEHAHLITGRLYFSLTRTLCFLLPILCLW